MEQPVPEQEEGAEIKAESILEKQSADDAIASFQTVKERLLSVNNWGALAGSALAHFQLFSNTGEPLEGEAHENNLIRIDIPGPGNKAGDGYDWVVIDQLINKEDFVSVRVRPSSNPLNDGEEKAHFYDEKSTSTFLASRSGNTIKAAVYDRNINANDDAETLVDKIRDKITATMAKLFFSKLQWQQLVDNFTKEA